MRQDVPRRQPQAGDETLIIWVNRFAGFFRLGIHGVSAVHTARADADDNAVEVCQQVTQVHRREKGVFGRYMPAGEQDYAALRDKLCRIIGVPAVQHADILQFDFRRSETALERRRHFVIARESIRVAGDNEQLRARLNAGAEVLDKAVARVENTGKVKPFGNVIVAGTAGQKERHAGKSPFYQSLNCRKDSTRKTEIPAESRGRGLSAEEFYLADEKIRISFASGAKKAFHPHKFVIQ